MDNVIEQHLEAALIHYTQDKYYQTALKAKKRYLDLTGSVDDSEEQDYENKMNCFNDWYLLQYLLPRKKCTVMEDYIKSQSLDGEIGYAFKNFNHSIFQYLGENFRGHLSMKDLWSKKKIVLNRETSLPLLKNDFFIGRVIPWQNEGYLMKGHSHLPAECWSLVKRQMRAVMKSQEQSQERSQEQREDNAKSAFLFKLESLNTKYRRYDHIDAAKIFILE